MEGKEVFTKKGTTTGLIRNATCMIILIAGSHLLTQELIAALVIICMNAAMTTNNAQSTHQTPLSRRPHVELVYAVS